MSHRICEISIPLKCETNFPYGLVECEREATLNNSTETDNLNAILQKNGPRTTKGVSRLFCMNIVQCIQYTLIDSSLFTHGIALID